MIFLRTFANPREAQIVANIIEDNGGVVRSITPIGTNREIFAKLDPNTAGQLEMTIRQTLESLERKK